MSLLSKPGSAQKRKYVISGRYKKSYSSIELFQQQYRDSQSNSQATPRHDASSVYKHEVEIDMMLPFRVRRLEKNNNNGEKKQAKLEIRKRMINERVKQR